MPIKDYSTDPDLNVSISGINIAEGCPPSGINNAIRQLMADVKEESEAQAEAITAASSALEAFAETQAQKDEAQDAKIADKLDKSGGTMTGRLINRNVDDSYIFIAGGTGDTVTPKSGHVIVYGKDHTYSPGYVVLAADNGVDSYKLSIKPDGTVTSGNNEVLTSGGGKLEGNYYFTQETAYFYKKTQTGSLVLRGGTSGFADGASLYLYGANNAEQGAFRLNAHDGSTSKPFIGNPNGSLTWDGKPVITLVASGLNSNGWYRKWSDGWIEQGGICANTNHATVTLPLPMLDSNYNIVLGPLDYDNDAVSRGITDVTSTTFRIKVGYNGSLPRRSYWYACGHGAN